MNKTRKERNREQLRGSDELHYTEKQISYSVKMVKYMKEYTAYGNPTYRAEKMKFLEKAKQCGNVAEHLKKTPLSVMLLEDASTDQWERAIRRNPILIAQVPKQTKHLQKIALGINPYVYSYIKNPHKTLSYRLIQQGYGELVLYHKKGLSEGLRQEQKKYQTK